MAQGHGGRGEDGMGAKRISRRKVLTKGALTGGALVAVMAGGPAVAVPGLGAGETGRMSGQNGIGKAAKDLFDGRIDGFAGKPAEAVLRELVDRELIRDIIHAYSLRVAHGLSPADLFTPDGAFIQAPGGGLRGNAVRGRAAMDTFYAAIPAGQTVPMIHNIMIEISGDSARAVSSIEMRKNGDGGESLIGSGVYRDQLIRVAGRWLFVEREVVLFHWGRVEPGWQPRAG
ncbi:nuclear transport factor 2 family protein [Novosphingobium bradum]|uniref:Nuclear transport factor 2 family protein n=1 Tax=Novosphingobium bradum TaxID=1737444 RepID=A0ABV7IVI5_9SPHN